MSRAVMLKSFFEFTSDSAKHIYGYRLGATDERARNSQESIFGTLEDINFIATERRGMRCCFRFLSKEYDWGTTWRKAKNEDCLSVDLVFLYDVSLPFYQNCLLDLSPGIQRLIIGLATHDVFQEVIIDQASKFGAWGHDPDHLKRSFDRWFAAEHYSKVFQIFALFDDDAELIACENVIPWLNFDDIVILYERYLANRGDFTTMLDSRFYFRQIEIKPKNQKK